MTTTTFTSSAPQLFPGTEAQRIENYNTHYFSGIDGRCFDCDCRPYGIVAQWPCGFDVPRTDNPVEVEAAIDRLRVGVKVSGILRSTGFVSPATGLLYWITADGIALPDTECQTEDEYFDEAEMRAEAAREAWENGGRDAYHAWDRY